MLKPAGKSTGSVGNIKRIMVKVMQKSRFRWTSNQLISYIINFRETPFSHWRGIISGSASGSNSGTDDPI